MAIQVISFKCLLKNKAGQVISTTFNREVMTVADPNASLLPGLALGLQNLTKGEKRKIFLSAEEAYGLYDPKKNILYPRHKIPKNLKIGDPISIVGKSGKVRSYRLLQFHDDLVTLDGNHPLAGQDLIFEIETLDAREATFEEISEVTHEMTTETLH